MESAADRCIFHSYVNGVAVYLALYVDDGLIAAKSQDVLDVIICSLRETFEITAVFVIGNKTFCCFPLLCVFLFPDKFGRNM